MSDHDSRAPGAQANAARAVPASCRTAHVNVEGYDIDQPKAYGNEGYVYINKQSTLNSIHNNIARSLFVLGPGASSSGTPYNDVEVGWTAGNGLFSNTPVVYAEWINRGVDSDFQLDRSFHLSTNRNYHFTVENVGGKDVWRFVVDNQSKPFNYSPKMSFNSGYVLTNSERNNSCDTLFASFSSLRYSSSPKKWKPRYKDYGCYLDDASAWYFHKISNSSSDVTQKRSSCGGAVAVPSLARAGSKSLARSGGSSPARTDSARTSQPDPLIQGQPASAASASAAVGFSVPTPTPSRAVSNVRLTQAWVNRQSREVALVLDGGKATVMMWPVAAANRNAVSYFKEFTAQNNARAWIGRINGSPALVIRQHTDADHANPAWVEFYRDGIDINIYSSSYSSSTLVELAATLK